MAVYMLGLGLGLGSVLGLGFDMIMFRTRAAAAVVLVRGIAVAPFFAKSSIFSVARREFSP